MTIPCGKSISPSREPIASNNGIQLTTTFARQGFENKGVAGLFQTFYCLSVQHLSFILGWI